MTDRKTYIYQYTALVFVEYHSDQTFGGLISTAFESCTDHAALLLELIERDVNRQAPNNSQWILQDIKFITELPVNIYDSI